jgi:hypothetical protein
MLFSWLSFKFVEMKKKCVRYPSSIYFAGESASGSENICDILHVFFGEVYGDSDEETDSQYQGVGGPAVLASLSFTVEDVEMRLLGLDASKGSGLLKSCSDGFKRPLTLLFIRLLSEGFFFEILETILWGANI